MGTINVGTTATSQLNAGASILAAARAADVRLIKPRFTAFENAQRALSAAHEKVLAAEHNLGAEHDRLGELDLEQRKAIDALAAALIVEGAPRKNPFTSFGGRSPSALLTLGESEAGKAIQQLVAAVQHGKNVSKPALQAATAVHKTAAAVEQRRLQIDKLQGVLREARHNRDATAQAWAVALAALKRGARAAADDGAPALYAALFDRPTRSNGKAVRPAPVPSPAPATTATS